MVWFRELSRDPQQFKSWYFTSTRLLVTVPGKAAEASPRPWVPVTHVGEPDEVLGACVWLGPVPVPGLVASRQKTFLTQLNL